MVTRKHLMTAILVVFCLTATLMAAIPTRSQSSGYDSWYDVNDDGSIDMADISIEIDSFMASGSLVKPVVITNVPLPVTVTNWPVQSPATFPRELILRGTMFLYATGEPTSVYRRDLIAEDTPYLPKAGPLSGGRYDNESFTKTVPMGFPGEPALYNETFAYQKIPTKAYQITGLPTVSLAFNVTNQTLLDGDFAVAFKVDLGTISTTGQWTTQYTFPMPVAIFPKNKYVDCQSLVVLAPYDPYYKPTPLSITVNAGDRLAIRVQLYASVFLGNSPCDVTFDILFGKGTDEFLADIPVVETP